MMTQKISVWLSGSLILLAAGCTAEPTTSPASNRSSQFGPSTQSVAGTTKPPVPSPAEKSEPVQIAPPGQPVPALDQGRVELVMPEGWKFLPRSSDYLFAAYSEDKSGIPRFILKVQDADDLPMTDSAESATRLVDAIRAEANLSDEVAIRVVQIGDNWFVRYAKVMKFRALPARGIVLETIQAGRRYQLQLQTYSDEESTTLPALYRFAASMKVEGSKSSDAVQDSENTDSTEPDASEGPSSIAEDPAENNGTDSGMDDDC